MNLHDELGRHGADATAGSARSLGSVEVKDALGARVRQGRRRRAAGGVGVVAVVALVAVGVWSVLPGMPTDAQPAGTIDPNLEIRGTTYEVDATAPVDPEIPIDLRLPRDLECGALVELDEGVTVHDSSVIDEGVRLAALSVSSVMSEDVTESWLRGLDEGERDVSWDNLVAENPAEVDATEEGQHAFESQVVLDGDANLSYTTIPLLLRDGEIVSIGVGLGGSGWEAEPSRMWTPNPGACGTEDASGEYGDGIYEPVLVSQFWSISLQQPLATIVYSAGEIEYTGLGDAADLEPDLGSAPDANDLPALGSQEYRASVVTVREFSGGLGCENLLDGTGPGAEVASEHEAPPVPSWIETGRLYGTGQDALIGAYPIPLATANEDWAQDLADHVPGEQDGPARLVLSGDGESWVFDLRWFEREDLPHDEPGWFIELVQDWECGSPDIIPEGAYDARLFYGDSAGQYDVELSPLRVVSGVPSIPELDEG